MFAPHNSTACALGVLLRLMPPAAIPSLDHAVSGGPLHLWTEHQECPSAHSRHLHAPFLLAPTPVLLWNCEFQAIYSRCETKTDQVASQFIYVNKTTPPTPTINKADLDYVVSFSSLLEFHSLL